MAKNYTFAEAVEIINNGTDMESLADIGRRFPILMHMVTKVTTKAGDDFVELMKHMPDHLTANKVNTSIKNSNGTENTEDVEADEAVTEAVEEKPAKAKKAAKAETTGTDYENMSGKELWDILGKAGKRKDCKEKMGGAKKEQMVEYINKYGLGDTAEEADEAEEVKAAAAESENPYEGISAMELFKECKQRGLKAAPKKPAKYYIEMLMEADAKVAEATAETESEDEDDWGDEAEEAPAPKAKEKKEPAKKPAKKAAAKAEETDEDDDWDI